MKNKLYQCKACGRITIRQSGKQQIKSYCDEMGTDSILVRIDDVDKITEQMCKKFLPNAIDLSSFKKKDILFLEMAFRQGATVMFNSFKIC